MRKITEKEKGKRIEALKNNRWLQKKHEKHSDITVAAWDSTVGQSTNDYPCYVCGEYGSRYSVYNKRRISKYNSKDWEIYGLRFCGKCIQGVQQFFNPKIHYCR